MSLRPKSWSSHTATSGIAAVSASNESTDANARCRARCVASEVVSMYGVSPIRTSASGASRAMRCQTCAVDQSMSAQDPNTSRARAASSLQVVKDPRASIAPSATRSIA